MKPFSIAFHQGILVQMLTWGWTTWRLCIFSVWSPFTKSITVSTILGLKKCNQEQPKSSWETYLAFPFRYFHMNYKCQTLSRWHLSRLNRRKKLVEDTWMNSQHFQVWQTCWGGVTSWGEEARHFHPSKMLGFFPFSDTWRGIIRWTKNHLPQMKLTFISFLMVVMLVKREMCCALSPSISCSCTRPLPVYLLHLFILVF